MASNDASSSTIHPVILSGGTGSRLWPMSRETYPKQFLSLNSELSLLQETARRVADSRLFSAPLAICNNEHRFAVAEQLRQLDVIPTDIVLEPVGRNTAPAAAVAALMVSEADADALMLLLPSDHVIKNEAAFHAAVETAAGVALEGALVTFGITPTAPETGCGYIRRGAPLAGHSGCYRVATFTEKPNEATARSFLDVGGYDWNSGMFLFAAKRYLEELGRLEPTMLEGCRKALAQGARDLDFIRLDEKIFAQIDSQSIDYAVMERIDDAAVVPVDIGWSDIGSWSALWELSEKDANGNSIIGDVTAIEVTNSYIRSEGRLVTAVGLQDIVIVVTEDAILALPKDRAQDVRLIVDSLKKKNRPEPVYHAKVYRPWGFYQSIHNGDRFQVKRITVDVGASLSLQRHHHRAEHWIVVNGTANVTRGDETFFLYENESTYIPPNTIHRLNNPGKVPLNLIEVQSGSYLGEDDIERIEDSYGR